MDASSLLFGLLLVAVAIAGNKAAITIDCQRPPQLVDPALCCQDGGRDETTEKCAQRVGLTDHPAAGKPPTVETATCLAECFLKETGYMAKPETLDLQRIEDDLKSRFSNDSMYVDTMVESFKKCLPNAQSKLEAFSKMPLGKVNLQKGCSPFAGILLGCTYMEYFKNCPTHRWTENSDCALAKQFVIQCGLGA